MLFALLSTLTGSAPGGDTCRLEPPRMIACARHLSAKCTISSRTKDFPTGRIAMSKIDSSEQIDRRHFFGTAAVTTAISIAAAQFLVSGAARAQTSAARSDIAAGDQAGNEHFVRAAQADRCRPAQCRIRRSRPRRRPRRHSAARLALRHLQLCRCRAVAGFGRLPGDRAVSARLRHDALSLERHVRAMASSRRLLSISSP